MVIQHTIQSRPRLLVTGLEGLVGSRLKAIAAGRWDLVNLSRRAGVDITQRDQVMNAVAEARRPRGVDPPPTALVHLAAYTDVSRAHAQNGDKQGPCHLINVVGTENVARACAAHGLRLIHISTDFVFDGSKTTAYTETDLPAPIEWYGRTKWMAEEAVRRASVDWTIARIAFPYSPEAGPKPDLVRTILGKLHSGAEMTLFDDQIITPTYADDIAQGLLLLARAPAPREVFHLVGGSSLTPFDLGLKIAAAFRLHSELVRRGSLAEYLKKDPRPRQPRLRVSNAKWAGFAQRHGLGPPVTIDEGIARVRKAWSASHPEPKA